MAELHLNLVLNHFGNEPMIRFRCLFMVHHGGLLLLVDIFSTSPCRDSYSGKLLLHVQVTSGLDPRP